MQIFHNNYNWSITFKNCESGVPTVVQWKQIQLVSMRMQVQSLGSLSGLRISIAVSCGVGCRHSLDPALLWLWHRLAAAAPIQPLAWELSYAPSMALKSE